MEVQGEQVPIVKKRFCCGAAKRLKEKCLRFHQDESKCIDFILGSCLGMQGIRSAWHISASFKEEMGRPSSSLSHCDPDYYICLSCITRTYIQYLEIRQWKKQHWSRLP